MTSEGDRERAMNFVVLGFGVVGMWMAAVVTFAGLMVFEAILGVFWRAAAFAILDLMIGYGCGVFYAKLAIQVATLGRDYQS